MGIKIKSFLIELDNSKSTYQPGDTVSGQVLLQTTGEVITSGIVIRISGIAKTHWLSGGIIESDQEILFEYINLLFGDSNTWEPLPSHEMNFPFQFFLPLTPLPPTLNINDCSTWYNLEVELKLPSPENQMIAQLPINLVSLPLDLNLFPGAEVPSFAQTEHCFKSFFCRCRSGPLLITAQLPQKGVCIGHSIPLEVAVDNRSNRRIIDLRARLIKVYTLYVNGSSHEDICEPLLEIERGEGVRKGGSVLWKFSMTIPGDAAPTLPSSACGIFKLNYEIEVQTVLKNFFKSITCQEEYQSVTLPVVLGNVPLALGSSNNSNPIGSFNNSNPMLNSLFEDIPHNHHHSHHSHHHDHKQDHHHHHHHRHHDHHGGKRYRRVSRNNY